MLSDEANKQLASSIRRNGRPRNSDMLGGLEYEQRKCNK